MYPKIFTLCSIVLLLSIISACTWQTYSALEQAEWNEYLTEHEAWKSSRVADLKRPMGYLSMVGLYWLSEGTQTIGSAVENDIVFPKKMPQQIGSVTLETDELSGQFVSPTKVNGKSITEKVDIIDDLSGTATMFNWESTFWYVIKRGGQYGIRVKDTLADSRLNFETMPAFMPTKEWVIEGTFTPAEQEIVEITNKVGITYEKDLAGTLSFERKGKVHELLATYSGDRLFIVFADGTNGTETYGGGRFLFLDPPISGDKVKIDFNKVENPICALSDFATCPLPRPENYLPFEVRAGEKKVR